MNEIKASVNALYDIIANFRQPLVFFLTAASFSGNNYTDAVNLINSKPGGATMIAGKDFQLYTNSGSGVLLNPGDGYTFDSLLGRITTTPDNYILIIQKQITI
jgi:hypothetical protein